MKKYLLMGVFLLTSCSTVPDLSSASRSETATMVESGAFITENVDTGEEESCAVMTADEAVIDESGYPPHSDDTLIISLENGITTDDISDLLKENGLEILYDYDNMNMIAVRCSPMTDEELSLLIDKLSSDDRIVSAEPDLIVTVNDDND